METHNYDGQRGASTLVVIGLTLIAVGVSGLLYYAAVIATMPGQSPVSVQQNAAKASGGGEARTGAACSRSLSAFEIYQIKQRMSAVLLASSQCRTAVAEGYQTGNKAAPPGANGWGCEAATQQSLASSPDVKSVETDENGVVTMTTASVADLCAAADKTIVMVPMRESGAPMVFARDVPSPVHQFRCSPGGRAPIDPKFLPSSCR